MTEEEIGLLHTLSKMPERSWLEADTGAGPGIEAWWWRLVYEGYIRQRFVSDVTKVGDRGAVIIQLTEAGRFYVRSTPEAA